MSEERSTEIRSRCSICEHPAGWHPKKASRSGRARLGCLQCDCTLCFEDVIDRMPEPEEPPDRYPIQQPPPDEPRPLRSSLPEDCTLAEAKDWLRARLSQGADCPCCTRKAKVYRRKLNKGMAEWLWRFDRVQQRSGEPFIHYRSVPRGGNDWSVLAHWGLISRRGENSGLWTVTDEGRAFLERRLSVPSHSIIYDNRSLRLDGDLVSLDDVAGEDFDWAELMSESVSDAITEEALPSKDRPEILRDDRLN